MFGGKYKGARNTASHLRQLTGVPNLKRPFFWCFRSFGYVLGCLTMDVHVCSLLIFHIGESMDESTVLKDCIKII